MGYNILETRVEFKDQQIERVTVLADCTGPHSKPFSDVRAIYATTKPRGGYMYIPAGAPLTNKLLQQVAAAGMEISEDRDTIFPGWKNKLELEIQD